MQGIARLPAGRSGSWEATLTFFTQLREPASGRAGYLRQWGTCNRQRQGELRSKQPDLWPIRWVAQGPGYFSGPKSWLFNRPTGWEARQPRDTHSGWWHHQCLLWQGDGWELPHVSGQQRKTNLFCKLFGNIKKGGPWPANIIGILQS